MAIVPCKGPASSASAIARKRPAANLVPCKRPASSASAIARKRPASNLAVQSVEDLQVYDEWARGKLEASDGNLGDGKLRGLLEQEHGVTAYNSTMNRWMHVLQAGRPAIPRTRPAPLAALPRLPMSSLQIYDEWGRAKLRDDAAMTHKFLRHHLEQEHHVTAADDTMRRWLILLQTPRKRTV